MKWFQQSRRFSTIRLKSKSIRNQLWIQMGFWVFLFSYFYLITFFYIINCFYITCFYLITYFFIITYFCKITCFSKITTPILWVLSYKIRKDLLDNEDEINKMAKVQVDLFVKLFNDTIYLIRISFPIWRLNCKI